VSAFLAQVGDWVKVWMKNRKWLNKNIFIRTNPEFLGGFGE